MESKEGSCSETLDHQISQEDGNGSNSDPSVGDSPMSQKEILRAVEAVERDSLAISDSYASLFASLRAALSQVTSSSVDHVQCFSDAAGRLQESALDSATKGNLYINSCLRLNEEMRGIDILSMQLKVLRRNVDALDNAVNSLVRLH